MLLTPKDEIEARIARIRPLMEKASLDGAFFHYKIDYYYLSGTMQDAILFVPLHGEPVLFVKRELGRARRESPLDNVIPFKTINELKPYAGGMKRIGLQLDVMPYNSVMTYKELLPEAEFVNCSSLTKALRKIKSPFEVKLMEKAAAIAKKVYAKIPEVLREGMREIELGGILEAYAKPLGHEGLLRMRSLNYEPYTWHILSGRTGSIVSQADSPMGGLGMSPAFPVGASMKKMRKGEAILIDFGINYHGYHMDLTRMYAIGNMPDQLARAYDVCRDIHYRVLDRAVQGTPASELFSYSRELADDVRLRRLLSWTRPPQGEFSGTRHRRRVERAALSRAQARLSPGRRHDPCHRAEDGLPGKGGDGDREHGSLRERAIPGTVECG